jgi:hypothetical protein
MDTKPFASCPSGQAMAVTRVADGQWHVLEDDLLVGRGHAFRRPDGRVHQHRRLARRRVRPAGRGDADGSARSPSTRWSTRPAAN